MRIKLYDQRGISLGYMKVEAIGETITLNGISYQVTHQEKLGDSLTKVVLKPIGIQPIIMPRPVIPAPVKKRSWLKSIFRRAKS